MPGAITTVSFMYIVDKLTTLWRVLQLAAHVCTTLQNMKFGPSSDLLLGTKTLEIIGFFCTDFLTIFLNVILSTF